MAEFQYYEVEDEPIMDAFKFARDMWLDGSDPPDDAHGSMWFRGHAHRR
jgi:hypothetical protein